MRNTKSSLSSLLDIPPDPSSRLRSHLLQLVDGRLPSEIRLTTYGLTFFNYLPLHVGQSPILDAAIACMCGMHEVRIKGPQKMKQALTLHNNAIRFLGGALSKEPLRKTAEILCAALILATLEVVVFPRHGEVSSNNLIRHV